MYLYVLGVIHCFKTGPKIELVRPLGHDLIGSISSTG